MLYIGRISIEKRYRLRWRFDFNGKPTKLGPWDDSGGGQDEKFKTAAWCTNKDGLTRASIEAESVADHRVVVLAECDGWDFVNFSWRRAGAVPLGYDVQAMGWLVGLTLETRSMLVKVTVDGAAQRVVKNPDEREIHLAGFGR